MLRSSPLLLLSGLFLLACSDDATSSTSSSSSGGTDGGGSSSSSSSSSSGGSGDGGGDAATAVNGCTSFVDRSGAGDARVLTWTFGIAQAPERCMKIKAGQTVKFTSDGSAAADFSSHPLAAQGGDTPNPVTNVDTSTGDVTFASAGTFGFVCSNHPAMLGAIQVE